MIRAALVPVPVLPPEPVRLEFASPVVIVLGSLMLVAATVFAVRVIRVIFGHQQTPRSLAVTVGLAAVALVLVAAAAVTDRVQTNARDDAIREWNMQAGEARRDAMAELEQAYGFTFDSSSPFVSMEQVDTKDESVTFADGTSTTCWFTVAQEHYEVTCGDSPETATPLEPVAP